MNEAAWKAIAAELSAQRDTITRTTGDAVAKLRGELAEANERIAALEAEIETLKPKES